MAVTDNFNRADGALGANWSVPTGQTGMVISGNEARGSGASNCLSYYNAFTPAADQYVQFKAGSGPFGPDGQAGFGTGGAVRVSTTARTCYILFINVAAAGEVQVAKLIAGARTIIGTYSAGATPVVGDVFKMTVVGSAIEVFKNGVSVLTIPSDTSISSGMLGMGNENWNFTSGVDDWEGDSIAGGSPVTLQVPLLSNSSTLYAPAVGIAAHIIQPPLITSGATLFAPTIAYGGLTLLVPLLSSSAVLYAPAVGVSGVIVAPPLITSGVTLFAPTIAYGGLNLLVPLLSSSAILYAPAVGISGVIVAPPLITSGATLFAPVIQAGVPVGTIAPPVIPSTVLLFPPLILPGASVFFPPLIPSTAQLFPPSIFAVSDWSPCIPVAGSSDWSRCYPESSVILAKIVASPQGGWMATLADDAEEAGTLAVSEDGGFEVDPTFAAFGAVEIPLENGPAIGIVNPDRAAEIEYSHLLEPEW